MRLSFHHLLVLTRPEATVVDGEGTQPLAVTQDQVVEAIASLEPLPDSTWLDAEDREEFAQALRERQLSATQRASEPFVFRSGGLLGSGKKVWTVKAAVGHMDRHPDDGIFHLDNGTLARWLSEQGAEHLADLAREVMNQPEREPRIDLERFLIGTGLVDRPRLSLRPKRVDLGYVLSGETRGQRIRAQKGRGRGYLFGSVRTNEPWLRIDPGTFTEGSLDAVVTADTEELPISQKPWRAQVRVDSSATEEPLAVPAQVRVVAMPSRLDRHLLRPLTGAVSAGFLGAGLGWITGRWGPATPSWFGELTQGAIGWAVVAAALLGSFWAVLGGIRGWKQPLSWPISYATRRWLVRTLIWGAVLVLLALVSHWAWRQFEPALGMSLSGTGLASIVLSALALAIVPSALGEIGAARHAEEPIRRPVGRTLLRSLLLVGIGIGLVLILVTGLLLVGPVWQQLDMDSKVSTAGTWAGEQWMGLEESAGEWIDGVFVRYYDRRATPRPTATPTAGPAASPTPGSTAP
jgi:hypothetical protein